MKQPLSVICRAYARRDITAKSRSEIVFLSQKQVIWPLASGGSVFHRQLVVYEKSVVVEISKLGVVFVVES